MILLWAAAAWAAAFLAVPVDSRAATLDARYQDAVKSFKKLRDDPASANRRDLWKALDAQLAKLAASAGKSPLRAKILYYQAWTNEEMAKRSFRNADHQAAVDLFQTVARDYPDHAWADDALLRRASILIEALKRPDAARSDLEEILRRHAKGDMAARARTLLAGLDSQAQPAKSPAKEEARAAQPSAPAATSNRPATLQRLAVDKTASGNRLTLTLDRETSYRYQLLEQARANGETVKLLYVDLDNTRTGPDISSERRYDAGNVSRLRAGYYTPETVRVVMELKDAQTYELRSETSPFRIVLDITAKAGAAAAAKKDDASEYRAAAVPAAATDGAKTSKFSHWLGNLFQSDKIVDPGPAPRAAKASPAPTEAAREKRLAVASPPAEPRLELKPSKDGRKHMGSLVEQLGLTIRTIMIDPGHGGKDPGAQGLYGVVEKDVNLRFARILGEVLRQKGFKVLYTRTTDVFIPLEERTEMANTKGADLFVSIHCNAHGDSGTSGLETYSLNLASSQDAVRVAARENAASSKTISDLQAILTDLMLSAKTAESLDLARNVQKRTVSGLRDKYDTRDRGPHEAPFFVLIGANMPAVLVELGYITNPTEAKRLASDSYLRSLAEGMAGGILAYKKRIERYANL